MPLLSYVTTTAPLPAGGGRGDRAESRGFCNHGHGFRVPSGRLTPGRARTPRIPLFPVRTRPGRVHTAGAVSPSTSKTLPTTRQRPSPGDIWPPDARPVSLGAQRPSETLGRDSAVLGATFTAPHRARFSGRWYLLNIKAMTKSGFTLILQSHSFPGGYG